MKKYLRFTVFLFALSFLVSGTADAQNKYKRRKNKSRAVSNYRGGSVGGKFRPYPWLGGNINALNYYGDLAPINRWASTDISFTRPGFGAEAGYLFMPNLALRGSFNWGRLTGNDATADLNSEEDAPRYYRNLSFRNDIWELNVGAKIFIFPEMNGPSFRRQFNFFAYLGVGAISHSPKGQVPEYDYQTFGIDAASNGAPTLPQAGEWVSLRDLGTEGQLLDGGTGVYSTLRFMANVSIGASLRLPSNFNAEVEIGLRSAFTDYLDDVSTTYVDYARFDNDLSRIMADRGAERVEVRSGDNRPVDNEIVTLDGGQYHTAGLIGGGIEGARRGNPDQNDYYLMTQIRLVYIIPKAKRRRRAKFR
jgi:hypothetical protein